MDYRKGSILKSEEDIRVILKFVEKSDDVYDVRLFVVTIKHDISHDLYRAISPRSKMAIRAQAECERISKDGIIGLAHFRGKMVGGLRITFLEA